MLYNANPSWHHARWNDLSVVANPNSKNIADAPVAQRIEHWFPKPCAPVRVRAGVPYLA